MQVRWDIALSLLAFEYRKRILPQLNMINILIFTLTGTFKLKKLALQREGYNPDVISDPLYFYDNASGGYKALDAELYEDIVSKKMRL